MFQAAGGDWKLQPYQPPHTFPRKTCHYSGIPSSQFQLNISSCKLSEETRFMSVLYVFLQDYGNWEVAEALPSYGRGIELQGRRYQSFITGENLIDVDITSKDILVFSLAQRMFVFCRIYNISVITFEHIYFFHSTGDNGTIDGQSSISILIP